MFTDHTTLKYLLKTKDVNQRLIRWILMLQEFELEIRNKRGMENLVTNHLNHLSLYVEPVPLKDELLYEHLFSE